MDSTVSVINAARLQRGQHPGLPSPSPAAAAGPGPDAVAIDGALHTVYAANGGGDTVSVINTSTCNAWRRTGCGRAAATIQVGSDSGIAIDQATGTVYVTNSGGDTKGLVINAATCNAGRHTGGGQAPPTVRRYGRAGIAVNQATSTV